jgi:hypothetical protein
MSVKQKVKITTFHTKATLQYITYEIHVPEKHRLHTDHHGVSHSSKEFPSYTWI